MYAACSAPEAAVTHAYASVAKSSVRLSHAPLDVGLLQLADEGWLAVAFLVNSPLLGAGGVGRIPTPAAHAHGVGTGPGACLAKFFFEGLWVLWAAKRAWLVPPLFLHCHPKRSLRPQPPQPWLFSRGSSGKAAS